ncbi:iron chaperone [Nigerium massiliense]|uniref:iron chaperone n=1 Tax=Nigerium massiliense TaxID=1522317 RepID=UPI00058DF474|nr:DUF1801 domain-containing protein [Nigerium massiliense]
MSDVGGRSSAVDRYIAGSGEKQRELMTELRALIAELAPEASEKISYGMPTFDLNGNLVHFAAFDRHVGFYPGADGVAFAEDRLAGFTHAKGSIRFPLDRPLPVELVRDIVEFRVAQNRAKPTKRRR